MGNCGSAPKTKGDEDVPAPEISKEESVKANTVEGVTVEQEEKTTTADADQNKDSDDAEVKPVDDNNQPSLGALLTESAEKEEKTEEEKKSEEASEETEEKKEPKDEEEGKTEPEQVSEAAAPAAIIQ